MKKVSVLVFAFVVALAGVSVQASTILMGPDVNNGSFESPTGEPSNGWYWSGTQAWKFVAPTGWIFNSDSGSALTGKAGTNSDGSFTYDVPEGTQHAGILGGGRLYQEIGVFEADTIYTLTGYGARRSAGETGTPLLTLSDGSDSYTSELPTADISSSFLEFSPIVVDTRVNPTLIGNPVQVIISSGENAWFDNIVLTATSVPEPASLVLLTLGGLLFRRKQ